MMSYIHFNQNNILKDFNINNNKPNFYKPITVYSWSYKNTDEQQYPKTKSETKRDSELNDIASMRPETQHATTL